MNFPLSQKITAVLVPVFALRGKGDLGIGDTACLKEFIDWAAETGVNVVKMLPVNETGEDNSPYNAISSQALDPALLHLAPDSVPGLKQAHIDAALQAHPVSEGEQQAVEYARVKPRKRMILEGAFRAFCEDGFPGSDALSDEFETFISEQEGWLRIYSIYRSLLDMHAGNENWRTWSEEYRSPANVLKWYTNLDISAQAEFTEKTMYFCYVQWVAYRQWTSVRKYAHGRNIALMGDIPFGISPCSADVWGYSDLFVTGWYGGTPPDKYFEHDAFVKKWGQNWGIPLYEWDVHREQNLAWWRERVSGVRQFFDLFRIDHILGFFRTYGFPWSPEYNEQYLHLSEEEVKARTGGALPRFHPRADDSETNCALNAEEGEGLLAGLLEEAGKGSVVGEDLGEVPDYVAPTLRRLGIAGYKVPQWLTEPDGSLVSGAAYERLSITTYGTHDHAPLRTVWESLAERAALDLEGAGAMQALANFAGLPPPQQELPYSMEIHEALVRALLSTNSWMAVLSFLDVFARTERINLPGVSGSENWTARMHAPVASLFSDPFTLLLAELIRELRPPSPHAHLRVAVLDDQRVPEPVV